MIDQKAWVWMPHPAHFICSYDCRFHLATRIGSFIVSTVGEYMPDEPVREIIANSRGVYLKGKGDMRRADYMDKIGFEDIGYNRKYESMVFMAIPQTNPEAMCCPWRIDGPEIEAIGCNHSEDAAANHRALCRKYAEMQEG